MVDDLIIKQTRLNNLEQAEDLNSFFNLSINLMQGILFPENLKKWYQFYPSKQLLILTDTGINGEYLHSMDSVYINNMDSPYFSKPFESIISKSLLDSKTSLFLENYQQNVKGVYGNLTPDMPVCQIAEIIAISQK